MDGVIYRGNQLIQGADEFVRQLRARSVPFRFLTNNSQRTRRDMALKLLRMGIEVTETDIYTSAQATARFVSRQKPNGTAFVIGEGGLLQALHESGFTVIDQAPDFVIVGEGRAFTLEMVESAVKMVMQGAKLIATNLDPSCPIPDGIRPGCGAIVAMIEKATGLQAFSVGKPSPFMLYAAKKELGVRTAECTMIGDTMETDILGGVQMGYRSVLVLSGGTRKEDLGRYQFQPDLIVNSVAEVEITG